MVSEVPELEGRLEAQLTQLGRECELFERLMHTDKNQHRRTLYYRVLCKVRRDLRLFQSAHLKDILKQHFQVIEGNKPTQKAIPLEGLKTRNSVVKGHDFQTKLLGLARLLAQMIEPIIEASLHISGLLGLSFFVGFSLAMLALLARLRVLLQQILHDVVRVFNMSSSVSQEQQSFRVLEGGPMVFRDHYPSNRPSLVLECHWDGVKFCLHEKFAQSKRAIADVEGILLPDDDQGNDLHSLPTASAIKYNNFGASGEAMDDNEIGRDNCLMEMASAEPSISATMKNKKDTNENIPTAQIRKPDCVVKKNNDHGELLLLNEECSKDLLVGKDSSERSRLSDSTLPQSSKPAESKSAKKRKVAFISVDVPLKTEAKLNNSDKKLSRLSDSTLSQSSKPAESKSAKKRKVAFISADVPLKTEAKLNNSHKKLSRLSDSTLSQSSKPAESKSAKKRKLAFISADVSLKTEAKLNNSHKKLSRLSDSTLSQSSKPAESKSAKKRKLAFISVDVPLKTEAKLNNSRKKLRPAYNNGLS